jgi:hypothetical protein
MAEGKLLTEGSAEEVKSNEMVIEAYLGRGASSGLNFESFCESGNELSPW